jgi:hypothetical protein
MKNVKYIFVLLLFINCTTDSTADDESIETSILEPQTQSCIDELPKVRLTNNSTQDFDFIVYGTEYTVLHTQSVGSLLDSGWIDMYDNELVIVATNGQSYGQKIQLDVQTCDALELEIDTNNVLSVVID